MLILLASDWSTAEKKDNNQTKLNNLRKFNCVEIEYCYLLYLIMEEDQPKKQSAR